MLAKIALDWPIERLFAATSRQVTRVGAATSAARLTRYGRSVSSTNRAGWPHPRPAGDAGRNLRPGFEQIHPPPASHLL